jgi:hypothetical protein
MSEEDCRRAARERYKLPADGKMSGSAGVTVVCADGKQSSTGLRHLVAIYSVVVWDEPVGAAVLVRKVIARTGDAR